MDGAKTLLTIFTSFLRDLSILMDPLSFYQCPGNNCCVCGHLLYRSAAERFKFKRAFGDRHNSRKAHKVTKKAAQHLLRNNGIILSNTTRICTTCFEMDPSHWNIRFETKYCHPVHARASEFIQKSINKCENPSTHLSFQKLSPSVVKQMCGLPTHAISEISAEVDIPCQNLLIFFTILRQHISQRFAAILFGGSQTRISRILHDTTRQLTKLFTPRFLGPTAFTRETILQEHTPEWVQILIPGVISIADGTYFYTCLLYTSDAADE